MLDWFHVAMRLQHLKQIAGALLTDDPARGTAKAVIVEEVERLHWRIWNGKAKEPVAQSPLGTSGRRGLVCFGVDGPGEPRFDHRSPTTRIERWRTIFANRNDVRLSCFRLT